VERLDKVKEKPEVHKDLVEEGKDFYSNRQAFSKKHLASS
jgi:hypothetical protein